MSGRRLHAPERIALVLVGLFVVAFAVAPAAVLFAGSVAMRGGIDGVAAVASDPLTRASVVQSLVQGGLSALLAVALGYPAGVFLGRYRWPGRAVVRSVLLVPFLLPSLVVVVGLTELFGPSGVVGGALPAVRPLASGIPGVVVVNLLFNVPIVMLFTASGCEGSSAPLEETVASLGGGPWRAYRDTWALPSLTGAAAGGLLAFVFSALSFAPPLLLCRTGCATVEVRVWQLAAGNAPDPAGAGVLALLLVGGFLAPTVGYLLLARRLPSLGAGPNEEARTVPWRSPAAWGLAAVTAAVLATELGLLAVVVARSLVTPGAGGFGGAWSLLFSPRVSARLGVSIGTAVLNSVAFAAVAAAIAVVVAVAVAFVGLRHRAASSLLGLATFLPVLLSPVVLAFALARLWTGPLGGPANVWLLVCLSQALLGLPFALQSLELPLTSLPASLRESAESLGATPWGAFADAELPRVAPGIERAALFALALGLGEFTATYFLVTPGLTTLPVAVYALDTRGVGPAAAAAAALLLFLSLAVYATTIAGARRVAG